MEGRRTLSHQVTDTTFEQEVLQAPDPSSSTSGPTGARPATRSHPFSSASPKSATSSS
jgi:hypothetical protein